MARVFGIEITDEQQAKTAKHLLFAHVVAILFSIIYAIVSMMQQQELKEPMERWNSYMGEQEGGQRGQRMGNNGYYSAIVGLILGLCCPLGVLIAVRFGIKENNQGLLKGVCFLDGCCSCCTLLGLLSAVWGIISYGWVQTWVQGSECTSTGLRDSDGAIHGGGADYSTEGCEGARSAMIEILDTSKTFAIVMAVFLIFDFGICMFATVKANKAADSLTKGQVFTGVPKPPPMGQFQPQEVGGPVVVGQVVQ